MEGMAKELKVFHLLLADDNTIGFCKILEDQRTQLGWLLIWLSRGCKKH